tara:strand:+ start:201 stop:431 length:231 start_codon:yes stop_codon:yes gene_type:complete
MDMSEAEKIPAWELIIAGVNEVPQPAGKSVAKWIEEHNPTYSQMAHCLAYALAGKLKPYDLLTDSDGNRLVGPYEK